MTDITPKTRLEGQRGHATCTRPWLDIVERYRAVESFAPTFGLASVLPGNVPGDVVALGFDYPLLLIE